MKEVGLMEFRFQPDPFEASRYHSVRTDIDRDLLRGSNELLCRSTTRPHRFSARVRKVVEPRDLRQRRPRPEPDGRNARQ
jgi:hypothetical protein